MSITISAPIYYKQTKKKTVLLGMNWQRNVHFQVLNNAKKWYCDLIGWKLKEVKWQKLTGQIHVHYNVYLKRRGSDGGNVRSVIEKFALDAFQKHGVIDDDNAEIVISDSSTYMFDKKNPRVEITIREIGGSIGLE